MQVNIQELVEASGLDEKLYPGRRLLKKYVQPGQFKSHCVTFDWLQTDLLHIELKAGTTGKHLPAKELKQYPVSFQAATYLDIDVSNDDDEEGTSGEGGSGGLSMKEFGKVNEGKITAKGEIKKFVVMGKELAQEAFAQAFENLKDQLGQAKVMAMDLMKDVIQKVTPGGGLEARGNETVNYEYNQERTAAMFGALTP